MKKLLTWNDLKKVIVTSMLATIVLTLITWSLFLLITPCFSQDKPKIEDSKKELERVKTWKMPDNLLKTLKEMVKEFNKQFQDTLDIYKYGLKAKMVEFKDMPDDVIFDMNTGVFMMRRDYIRLQREANDRLLAEANKDKEVKKDEKKTN